MTTIFQRLFNFHSSKTAFSQPLIPKAIGINLNFTNTKTEKTPYTTLCSKLLLLGLVLLGSWNLGWGQTCPTIPTAAGTHSVTFDVGNNCTFTIPAGVTSIKVQAWGGGGSGGSGNTTGGNKGGGGGGGGNYVQKNSISVTGGSTSIVVRVGAAGSNGAGGDSEVDVAGANVIDAGGGNKGGNAPSNGGGSAPTLNYTLWCSGGCDVSSYGGIGSCGYNTGNGGGGGEGGCSNGSNGRGQSSCGTGGGNQSTGYDGNGDGGSGGGNSAGTGSAPGGGGGGRGSSTSNGGNGGGGRVIITYTVAACSVLTSAGTVTGNQTICSGGDPVAFTSDLPSGGSGGTITYQWQSSTDNVTFTNIASNGTSQNYDPPSGLSTTTYYRRQAKRCTGGMEVTSNVITVTVPTFTRNTPTGQQCSGTQLNFTIAPSGAISYTWAVRTQGNSTHNSGSGFVANTSASPTSGSASTFSTIPINTTGVNTTFFIDASISHGGTTCTHVFSPTINPAAAAPTSVTPSATTICHGNSVNLNATSAGNTINWYTVATDGTAIQTGVTSAANHSVSPTANTTYYAEAQNGSGCKSSRVATGLVTVENPVSAVNTAIGTTLQTNDYVWVGQTNSTWSTANNWRQFNGTNLVAASAPGSNNTNRIYVVQNSTSSNCIFNATSLSLGSALGVTSLFVGTGTSLNLNNQNVDLSGNITFNGTFTPGSGTITLSGNTNQTLDGTSALSFSNLTINKSGGTLTASKDMTITGTLDLTSGILDMNSKALTMGTSSANGTITGGSASSYIVALDATTPSKLIHWVNSTSNATYSFPIGTGSKYTPVTVVMKGGTLSNASIQVWTKNSKVTGMSNAMSCHLNRAWFVEPTGITSPTYDIQLGFASGDFTGDAGFDLNPVKLSSGVWYKPSGSLLQNGTTQGTTIATTYASPSTPTSSSGTVYWNGLTSFSEFGGGGGSAPLPVELVSFSGSCEDGSVHLSWQTASEFNSSHFDVEKSRDGENWQVIETISAAGNSHELLNYETFDQVSNALNYYRLNQVDIDGTNKRYDPIVVSCEASSNGIFITYPNPSNEGFNVLINDNELEGEMNMNIYTATGSVAHQKRIVVKEGINVFMMNEKLLPGVYFIEVKDQQNKTKVIKHLVN